MFHHPAYAIQVVQKVQYIMYTVCVLRLFRRSSLWNIAERAAQSDQLGDHVLLGALVRALFAIPRLLDASEWTVAWSVSHNKQKMIVPRT